MEPIIESLEKLGLTDKESVIYLALLRLGPSAIRKVAAISGINRGSTYEILRNLQQKGLVSYYHKRTHQHFVAEDPKILENILLRRKEEIENVGRELKDIIPHLNSLSKTATDRPTVKYYENYSGLRSILEDALDTVEKLPKKEYSAYSSSAISPYLYHKKAFPDFTESRIKRKIFVRTIASGPGGSVHGQDERKWLTKKDGAPTYILIYSGKVSMISIGKNNLPHGLIIEDREIYETQQLIFDSLWKSL